MAFPMDPCRFTKRMKLFYSLQAIHFTFTPISKPILQHSTAGTGFELDLNQTRYIVTISNFFLVSSHNPAQMVSQHLLNLVLF